MDAKNIKPSSLSLDKMLQSYNLLITFLVLFIFLVIILLIFNPKGFNLNFGYEVFITIPIMILLVFLIKEVIILKNNPQQSIFKIFTQYQEKWFLPLVIISILIISIGSLFSILYIAGIFSSNPPENNIPMLINFLIIFLSIGVLLVMYNKSKAKDDILLKTLPNPVQDAFKLRTKYTIMFVLFLLSVMTLYFVNPYGIMTTYGGPTIFLTLFIGIIFVLMITIYQYFLSNKSESSMLKDSPGFFSFLIKGVYVLTSLTISGLLIYWLLKTLGVFNQDASKSDTWGHIFFNIILFCAMLGIIYKLVNAGGFISKNPYYRLIVNTFLYIPCLLVMLFEYVSKKINVKSGEVSSIKYPETKPTDIKILIFSLILLGSYFLWLFLGKRFLMTRYITQGGKQLINQPISTNTLTNVASYQTLVNDSKKKYDYNYAISFWFYLDSFPPSTNASYLKIVPILSYGENPLIKYSSTNNTLYITVKQDNVNQDHKENNEKNINEKNVNEWKNSQTQSKTQNQTVKDKINDAIEQVKTMVISNDIDADGHRIIYKHPDVLLQKWNQIILNYNGGTLDVFYNGKLVKSAIEVVPYMKFDMLTVGTENGISGNIANLLYFNNPLDILTINTLYTSLKDKSPPTIAENTNKLIPNI